MILMNGMSEGSWFVLKKGMIGRSWLKLRNGRGKKLAGFGEVDNEISLSILRNGMTEWSWIKLSKGMFRLEMRKGVG